MLLLNIIHSLQTKKSLLKRNHPSRLQQSITPRKSIEQINNDLRKQNTLIKGINEAIIRKVEKGDIPMRRMVSSDHYQRNVTATKRCLDTVLYGTALSGFILTRMFTLF